MVKGERNATTAPDATRRHTQRKLTAMFQEFIVLTAAYVLFIAWIYAPRHTSATDPAAPVEYFPEIEETPAENFNHCTTTITEPRPAAAYVAPIAVKPDLSKMGCRELYKLAAAKGVKRYKSLRKAELIAALQ